MKFWLGTHHAEWLARTNIPLFVSRRAFLRRKATFRATAPWALDSGGFSELNMYGKWQTSLHGYVDEVYRYLEKPGNLRWAAIQDWMCEPFVLAKTGKSIEEHQLLTVLSYLELTHRAPDLPFVPVIQGWESEDYERCIELYREYGVRLEELPLVGLGSVCRRQGTDFAAKLVARLVGLGIKIHAFGFKVLGLRKTAHLLESSDSLAWSYAARRSQPLPTCSHKSCANCMNFAMSWRDALLKEESIRVHNQPIV